MDRKDGAEVNAFTVSLRSSGAQIHRYLWALFTANAENKDSLPKSWDSKKFGVSTPDFFWEAHNASVGAL